MKILFINNGNINGIGGNTIQLIHELNMWSQENEVHYFSFTKVFKSTNFLNLNKNVNVIVPTYKFHDYPQSSIHGSKYAEFTIMLDEKENYDLIICRGAKLNWELFKVSEEIYAKKVVCYITDTNNIDDDNFEKLYSSAKFVKCQHENYLKKFPSIPKDKVIIQPPIVIEEKNVESVKKYDIVYAGTIAKTWGVDLFLEFVASNPEIKAAISYTSLASVDKKELKYFENLIFNTPNLEVFHSLSNNETKILFSQSKVSYCYKNAQIDNDNSTEISTKLLESLELGCLPIVRDTKVHRDILGNSYEYYCENDEELEKTIKNLIASDIDVETLKKVSEKYYPNVIYSNIKKVISSNLELL